MKLFKAILFVFLVSVISILLFIYVDWRTTINMGVFSKILVAVASAFCGVLAGYVFLNIKYGKTLRFVIVQLIYYNGNFLRLCWLILRQRTRIKIRLLFKKNWISIGVHELERKNYDLAELYSRLEILKDIDYVNAWVNLARIRLSSGNHKKALQAITIALKIDEHWPIFNVMGQIDLTHATILGVNKQFDKAKEITDKVLAKNPYSDVAKKLLKAFGQEADDTQIKNIWNELTII